MRYKDNYDRNTIIPADQTMRDGLKIVLPILPPVPAPAPAVKRTDRRKVKKPSSREGLSCDMEDR